MTVSTAPSTGVVNPSTTSRMLRAMAAAGAAATVAGVLVAFVGGRLAMRLLAAANPEDTGQTTDDGFAVGAVTAGGTAQVLLAALQISLLGAAVYLLIRPLLMGPTWLRISTVALGVGVAFGALLTAPDSFDFVALEPRWLPILLFTLLPALHVVAFAVLAERWLAEGSWFQTAPTSSVAPTLLLWLAGGVALILVLPASAVVLLVLYVAARHPPSTAARHSARWLGRVALGAVFVLSVTDLFRDFEQLVL